MAKLSVSRMPVASSAWSRSKSTRFSVWSGQAGSPGVAGTLVHQLRQGLRQPVRQCLQHNGVVVIVVLLKLFECGFDLKASRYRKAAHIVRQPGLTRRYEIRQSAVEVTLGFFCLLTKRMKRGQHRFARFISVDLNIVTHAVGWEKAD